MYISIDFLVYTFHCINCEIFYISLHFIPKNRPLCKPNRAQRCPSQSRPHHSIFHQQKRRQATDTPIPFPRKLAAIPPKRRTAHASSIRNVVIRQQNENNCHTHTYPTKLHFQFMKAVIQVFPFLHPLPKPTPQFSPRDLFL